MTLVEIAAPRFDADSDIAYATANNFTGAPVRRKTWLEAFMKDQK